MDDAPIHIGGYPFLFRPAQFLETGIIQKGDMDFTKV